MTVSPSVRPTASMAATAHLEQEYGAPVTHLPPKSSAIGAVVTGSLLLAGSATLAQSQEFCVVCEGPAAVYRCVLEGIGPAQAQPLKVVCITTIARELGHASCGVKGGTVMDCNGAVKRVQAQGKALPGPDGTLPEPTIMAAPAKPVPSPDSEPKTMEEVARRVSKSTADGAKDTGAAVGNAVKKTGDAIGGAVQKTWNCVTTLFKAC